MRKANDSVSGMAKKNMNYDLKANYAKAMKDDYFKKVVSKLKLPEKELMKYTSRLMEAALELKNSVESKNIMECNNKVSGYVYTPRVEKGGLIFSYVATSEMEEFLNDNEYKKNIYTFELPRDITNANIKDIDKTDKNRLVLLKKLTSFMTSYMKGKEEKGLYVNGNFGSGKTYLVSAFFNEMAKKGKKSAIAYFPEFLRSLKEGFSDNSYISKFNKVKKAPLLLIDDIGAEDVTPWSRDEILGSLLQYRMEEHLPTFFTSNLSISELETHLSKSRNKVDGVKARRIIERVKQLTNEVELVSKNRRK
jgi:primosomal protein DnaI